MACTTQPEGCGSGHSDINGKCYHQSDLDVLQDFIDNSSGSIISNLDTYSSGNIEPLELQIQKWKKMGDLLFYGCMLIPSVVKYPKALGN